MNTERAADIVERERMKYRVEKAEAERAAFRDAFKMVTGAQGNEMLAVVERVAAGLLARGGF